MVLLAGLGLENASDWKENSHRIRVHDSEDIGEANPILGNEQKYESRTSKKNNEIAETENSTSD